MLGFAAAGQQRTSNFLKVSSSCITPGDAPGLRSLTSVANSSSFSSASRLTTEGLRARHKTSDITYTMKQGGAVNQPC